MKMRFHHGRVSLTLYAEFSVLMSAPNTAEPDQRASTAPTEMSPGAFVEKTTSLMTLRTRSIASLGTTVASWFISHVKVVCLSPKSERSGAAKRKKGKMEKNALYAACAARPSTLSSRISFPVVLRSGPTRYPLMIIARRV